MFQVHALYLRFLYVLEEWMLVILFLSQPNGL